MPSMKARLDLTVDPRIKEDARKMARERRRSISGLFEDLVVEEKDRQKKIWHTHIKHVFTTPMFLPALSN
jgi:hypothetical protein